MHNSSSSSTATTAKIDSRFSLFLAAAASFVSVSVVAIVIAACPMTTATSQNQCFSFHHRAGYIREDYIRVCYNRAGRSGPFNPMCCYIYTLPKYKTMLILIYSIGLAHVMRQMLPGQCQIRKI